jgi:hypothetical protein
MTTQTPPAEQPKEMSLSDLRALMSPKEPVAPAEKATPEETTKTPAKPESQPGAAEPAKPDNEKQTEPERDESGKFKAKEEAQADDLTLETDSEAIKKRIGKAVAKQREAERKAAELEAEVERLRKDREAAPPETESQAAQAGKPSAEDFDSTEQYVEALLDWREAQKAQKAQANKVDEKIAKAREEYPDFENIAMGREATSLIVKQPALGVAITESDIFPKLAMHLGQNLDELRRLTELSPTRALAELGKIEDRLSKPAPKRETSQPLPKPPVVVSPGSPQQATKPEEMGVSELREYMAQLEAKRNRF